MPTNPFFDRPIVNSPYEYPRQHWELDESGQPGNLIERRRPALRVEVYSVKSDQVKRAISIRQPYVELILRRRKTREYRSRRTNIRERVYLYAALRPADWQWES